MIFRQVQQALKGKEKAWEQNPRPPAERPGKTSSNGRPVLGPECRKGWRIEFHIQTVTNVV